MEQIHPYAKAPWIFPVKVIIPVSRAEATRAAQKLKDPAGYTDTLGRKNLIGIGVH